MTTDPVDPGAGRLSPQQRRLLRRIAAGVTASKALAQETGLSPRSIDTYLHAAARELGVEGRVAAAARFVALEQTSQAPSQLRADGLVDPPQSRFSGTASSMVGFFTRLPLGGEGHTRSAADVTLQILRVGVIGMAGLSLLVLFLLGFLRVFR